MGSGTLGLRNPITAQLWAGTAPNTSRNENPVIKGWPGDRKT
jgi:hypothetical protein